MGTTEDPQVELGGVMTTRPGVVVLGGGMAGVTAAWRLSEGDWRARFSAITVVERSHRLGGKGASSRGANGRIEEHGLTRLARALRQRLPADP